MAAAWKGSPDCVNLLLAARASVNVENETGQTAIQLTRKRKGTSQDRHAIIEMLTSAGLAQKVGLEWSRAGAN